MITILATLECSNIKKIYTKLKTSSVTRGDIIKHYKTNYDPMLELHNSFFDKCLDHLTHQEILKNDSFFMKSIDNVKDLFTKGIIYEPLFIPDLGITIKCENYLNQIVSDKYISRKKEELKNVKTNLFNFNQQNNIRIPKGRAQSESGSTSRDSRIMQELEQTMRKKGMSEQEIKIALVAAESAMAKSSSSNGGSISISSNGGSGSSSLNGGSSSGSSSLNGGSSSGSSSSYSSSSSSSIGGSSNSSSSSTTKRTTSTTTITRDSEGNIISGGSSSQQGNSERSKEYSGSTISGMGAKFSIFSDRKIIKKEGKEYVIIGGVEHLIDVDGWIHGLNIDSSDKNINYNIAYENYFDTTCESMLTFMKNKYTQLLADYNMNKDYVHNLQIENRRYIKKVEVLTTENTNFRLELNTCNQKIQDEKVKKSTLYHNIKDIKTIKVDTRVKEMEETITKYEKTINNFKIEILNLKQIIKVNIDKCNSEKKECNEKCESKWKIEFNNLGEKCKKEKDELNLTINQLNLTINNLQITINNYKLRVDKCDNDERQKKLTQCQIENIKYKKENERLLKLNLKLEIQIRFCEKNKVKCENDIKIINIQINTCKEEKKICKKYEDDLKICTDKQKELIEKHTTIVNEITIEKNRCNDENSKNIDYKSKYLSCDSQLTTIKFEKDAECENKIYKKSQTCEDEAKQLRLTINTHLETIRITNSNLEKCNQEKANEQDANKNCQNQLTVIISEKEKECKNNCDSRVEFYKKSSLEIQLNLDNCKKEKDELERTCKTTCENSQTIIIQEKETIIKKNEKCERDKSTIQEEINRIQIEIKTIKLDLENCQKQNRCDDIIKDCKLKKELTCQDYYINIKNELEKCKSDLNSQKSSWTVINNKYTLCTNDYQRCSTKLDSKDSECKLEINNLRLSLINEETKKCEKQIEEITTSHKSITITIENCQKEKEKCDKEKNEYKDYKEFKLKFQTCENDLRDEKNNNYKLTQTITTHEQTIKNYTFNLKTCQDEKKQCISNFNSNQIRIELESCDRKLKNSQQTIDSLLMLISTKNSQFLITISEIRSEYEKKIEKLSGYNNNITERKTTTTTTVTTITKTITNNDTSIEEKNRQIRNLKDKIKSLTDQKKDYLSRLDTVDCSNISIVNINKQYIINIQEQIEESYNQITNYQSLITSYQEENAKYRSQIEMYKENEKFYEELIDNYSQITTDQSDYIKRLNEIINDNKVKNKDGQIIDINIYINNKDELVKDLKIQIEKNIKRINELKIKYEKDVKIIREDCNKNKEYYNNQINIYIQNKSEFEEKCNNTINLRIKTINRQYTEMENYLKLKYREELNECKRNCKNRISTDEKCNEYNFEIYKKHCIALIDKNTENDCKAISEIRTIYNEKCIMTALPSSGKDLTTFASSDFTDDRNSLMMQRLNTKN